MTYGRAIIIAYMSATLPDASGFVEKTIVFAAGGVMWWFTTDPLPAAIERGLEAFARRSRR